MFDLSLKSVKPRLLKSKWLFLNTLSQIKSYRFRLITKRGHYKFSSDITDAINRAEVKITYDSVHVETPVNLNSEQKDLLNQFSQTIQKSGDKNNPRRSGWFDNVKSFLDKMTG